ncbi:MAG: HEAT repeat domain-containing protein [Solirubrobacteraceae bacterium]
MGDREAVEVAIGALSDARSTRRLAAARALGVLGDMRAREPLRGAQRDDIAGVRANALGAPREAGNG